MPISFSDLERRVPQIRQTLQEWQSARQSSGEDPTDWEAFRQHCQAIGAADPGSEAPQEFYQAGQRGAGGILGQLGQQAQQAGQQAQQRGGDIFGRLTGQQKQQEEEEQ